MNAGALITIAIFLGIVCLAAFFSIRLGWCEEKQRQKKQEKAAKIALRCNPAYAQMEERDRTYSLSQQQADRNYELARERQTVELALGQARFQLEQYITRTRVSPETYLIGEIPQCITPLPSLKPPSKTTAIAGTAPFQIPPAYDLLDIFLSSDITPHRIFLGKSQQDRLFIQENQLHHAAFSASTGYGKTTLVRGIIPQLLHIGHHVVIADLKYTDVTEKGEDWRPIAARIFEQEPLTVASGYHLPNILRKEEQIATLLHWLAYPEMQRRLDMRASRNYSYPTLDVFLEELVALTVAYPSVTKDILRIISLGRELRLNLFTTAQNMQVSSVGLSGGAREQFTTAWFLGGDEVSAAALLDMPRKELSDFLHDNNIILGQGIGMMRNNYVMPTAGLVRLGYSSNASIYHLLGKADDFELTPTEERQKNRSYSVPQMVLRNSTVEQINSSMKNHREPDTEPSGTGFLEVLQTGKNETNSPFLLFTEEQRASILEAARQPNMSLKKIRTAAKIGNDSKRWTALKIWLQMNGYSFHQKEHDRIA